MLYQTHSRDTTVELIYQGRIQASEIEMGKGGGLGAHNNISSLAT